MKYTLASENLHSKGLKAKFKQIYQVGRVILAAAWCAPHLKVPSLQPEICTLARATHRARLWAANENALVYQSSVSSTTRLCLPHVGSCKTFPLCRFIVSFPIMQRPGVYMVLKTRVFFSHQSHFTGTQHDRGGWRHAQKPLCCMHC